MKRLVYIFLIVLICFGCKSRKKKGEADNSKFFPVLSVVQSEIKDVDTSVYRIIKVETKGDRRDTTDIPREDFSKYAADFLDIPDITADKWKGDYYESSHYDTLMGRVNISYTATDPDMELLRQDISIMPTFGNNDQVKTIYMQKITNQGDSTVEKKMFWEVHKSFRIITIVQKENEPEKVRKLEVFWHDYTSSNQ
jgi:hypothetical protein